MKPYIHAQNSVSKFGGKIEDYLPIHDFFDSSKAHLPDMRHRAIFHSSFGIYIVERIFGTSIVNSDGKVVQVRDIGEQHVLEDMGGRIPTVQDYLSGMPFYEWLGGNKRTSRTIKMLDKEVKSTDLKKPKSSKDKVVKDNDPLLDSLRRLQELQEKVTPRIPKRDEFPSEGYRVID